MHEIKLLLSISVQGQNRVTIALIHLRSVFFGHSSYSYKSPERRFSWIVSSQPVFRSYSGTNPSSFCMRLPSTAISSVYLSIITRIAGVFKPIKWPAFSITPAKTRDNPAGSENLGGFRPRAEQIDSIISFKV